MLTPAVFLCVCSIFFHLMSISIKQYLPIQQERWHGDSKMEELDDLWEECLPTRLKVGMAQRKKKKKIKLSAFRLVPCKPDLLHWAVFSFFFPIENVKVQFATPRKHVICGKQEQALFLVLSSGNSGTNGMTGNSTLEKEKRKKRERKRKGNPLMEKERRK